MTTTFSPLGALPYGLGALTALAVIAGGVILFAVGKGRGALSGTGYLVLGIGTIANAALSLLLPQISLRLHLATTVTGGLYSAVSLLFSVIGWGLVIAALFRFRGEDAATPGGYPPQPPSAYPPPPPGPGPYGQPGYPPGQGHSVPGPGPERPPYGGPAQPYGQDEPNPGWGGPPYGTEGPPPPPGY